MTLTIQKEEDTERQLKVVVEVPEERVQSQMRQTARKLSREIRIPGFRKGKVPYNVLVNRIGEKALRADAIEEMIEPVFLEALDEIGESPYGQPTLDDVDMEPLVIKLTIPLEPTVQLGEYRSIRRDLKAAEVTEDALEEAIEQLRATYQELEEVERPAELNDMVVVSGEGKVEDEEGEIIWREEDGDILLDPEKVFADIPFVENIVGLSAGEEKTFHISFPDDYEDQELAGKSANFTVTVNKVQDRTLPELDDELAKKAGEYESVDELRKAMEEELLKQAEDQVRNELLDEWVDDLLEDAELSYPPAVIETELDSMVEEFRARVTRSGWQWEDFLKLQGETESSLRENWREGATDRIRRGLVIRKFAEAERLAVDSEDIDLTLEKRLSQYGENQELQEQLRSVLTQGRGLESMSTEILMDKVVERIEQIISGNAPDLEELERQDEQAEEEE